MNEPSPSIWLAKPELSDEAAAQVLDFLYELVISFENAYFGQLHRYYYYDDNSETPTQDLCPQHSLKPDEDSF